LTRCGFKKSIVQAAAILAMLLQSLVATVHATPQNDSSELADAKPSLLVSSTQGSGSALGENSHEMHSKDAGQMSCPTHASGNQGSCCQSFCYSGFYPSIAAATGFFGGKAKHQFAEEQVLSAFDPSSLNRPPRI
jgi:hypothetical protein